MEQFESGYKSSQADLSLDLALAGENFRQELNKQGIVGQTYDWMKNNLGTSAQSEKLAGRIWSRVLDADMGSEAVGEKLAAAEKTLYMDRALEAPQTVKKAGSAVADFAADQKGGVGLLADSATIAALILTRRGNRGMLGLALTGATTRTAVKALDGTYSRPVDDALTGALLGAALPAAEVVGLGMTKFAGASRTLSSYYRLPAAVGGAGEGAIFGIAQQYSSTFERNRENGARLTHALYHTFKDASSIPEGANHGIAAGLVSGFLFARLPLKVPASRVESAAVDIAPPVVPSAAAKEMGLEAMALGTVASRPGIVAQAMGNELPIPGLRGAVNARALNHPESGR